MTAAWSTSCCGSRRCLALFVVCVAVAKVLSQYAWGADVIPLLLFGMVIAIAYHQELALLLSLCTTLVVVVAIGHGFTEALALAATVAGAVLVLRQVRTRSRLLVVGFAAAAVGFFTTLGVGILDERSWTSLLTDGFTVALWSIIAGSLMTGLLPFVEQLFGVLTDLSLLELGDVAHPLLQELVRRAPGTYNHSITVGSIAEAAAEAIGARGLLVPRRGLLPRHRQDAQAGLLRRESNQGGQPPRVACARHEHAGDHRPHQGRRRPGPAAPPAAADHRPDRAAPRHDAGRVLLPAGEPAEGQADPDGGEVDESSFRYPGPKPQTKEAAVLMLADAVESASRTLVDPTPARIESLVHEISRSGCTTGSSTKAG